MGTWEHAIIKKVSKTNENFDIITLNLFNILFAK